MAEEPEPGSPAYDYTKTKEYFEQIQEFERDSLRKTMEVENDKLTNAYNIARLQARTEAEKARLDDWFNQERVKLLQRTAALEKSKFGLERQKNQFAEDMGMRKFGLERDQFRQARAQFEAEHGLSRDQFRLASVQQAFDQALQRDQYGLQRDQFRLGRADQRFQQDLSRDQYRLSKDDQRFQQELARDKFRADEARFGTETALALLKHQSSLSGPANFVQSANFAQGVQGDPRYAGFMRDLVRGDQSRMFGAASGAPQAQSLGQQAALLGGTQGGGNGQGASTAGMTAADQLAASGSGGGNGSGSGGGADLTQMAAQARNLVQGAGQLAAAGGGALGAQALERQSPTNMALLKSGMGGAGADYDEWIHQYNASRVGQGAAGAL